jgi:hypothetical protein
MEKNGHTGLACDRPRQQRFPGPRRADQQHALGRRPAQARVLRRVLQEVHDLDELVLRLVDPGDIVKGHLGVSFLIVAPRLAPADAHEPAADAEPLLRPPEHPDVKPDEQQGRAEAQQKRRPGVTALLDRLGHDLDAVRDQVPFQARVDERGQRGREGGDHFPGGRSARALGARALRLVRGRCILVGRGRIHDRRLEAAGYRVTLAVDHVDVALADLFLEQGIRHGDRAFRAGEQKADQQEVHEQGHGEPEPAAARRHVRRPGTLRRPRPRVAWLAAPGAPGISDTCFVRSGRAHGPSPLS